VGVQPPEVGSEPARVGGGQPWRYGHPVDDLAPARRRIPRTDALLADPRLTAAQHRLGRPLVKAAIAKAQARARNAEIPPEQVADAAVAELPPTAASLTPVINATGVIVHTNLGRAPLSAAAVAAMQAAAGNCDVEFDLESGTRSQRGRGALRALREAVPGAGAAGVVNNNAAALVLAATALAAGQEIVISRGELIEIGDRFRLPDLLTATGALLREVGTTNRTTAADYAAAIGPETGFVLKVHPSNYRITGFTSGATVPELAALGVPVVHDIGSGLLAPHPLLPGEPDAATSLAQGANLVTASGDKLLGGPQAGLLIGDAELVRRLLRHPLARALRVDKLTLPPSRRRSPVRRLPSPARCPPPLPPFPIAQNGSSRLSPATPFPRRWRTPRPPSAAAARRASRCPAPPWRCPRSWPSRCAGARRSAAARPPPWSAGWPRAGCCSTCARWTRMTTTG
jgi:L-seryl-tRNA(Ser) seleniumtransferase